MNLLIGGPEQQETFDKLKKIIHFRRHIEAS